MGNVPGRAIAIRSAAEVRRGEGSVWCCLTQSFQVLSSPLPQTRPSFLPSIPTPRLSSSLYPSIPPRSLATAPMSHSTLVEDHLGLLVGSVGELDEILNEMAHFQEASLERSGLFLLRGHLMEMLDPFFTHRTVKAQVTVVPPPHRCTVEAQMTVVPPRRLP